MNGTNFKESVCTCGSLMRLANKEEIDNFYEPDLPAFDYESAKDRIYICSCGKLYFVVDTIVKGSQVSLETKNFNLEGYDLADGRKKEQRG